MKINLRQRILELTNWLDTQGAEHTLAGLYTVSTLRAFYEKFGFIPVFGMNRKIHRREKENPALKA